MQWNNKCTHTHTFSRIDVPFHLTIAIFALWGLGACAGGEDIAGSEEALRDGRRLTARQLEALYPRTETVIGPRADVEALTHAAARGNTSEGTTLIDATEGRTVFPMPARIRRFRDREHMASVLAAELGIAVDTVAVEQTVRGASEPHSIAFSGSYTMHGSTYWTDPATSVRYRVSDPVAGRIGGVTGQIYLGGERICIDPDGRCADDDRASYLEPEGGFTAPTHAYINGSNGVVATFHTFFNKTYFPWFWARHGNRTSINFAALPTTRLMASGVLWTTFDGGIVIDTPMPTSVVNHHEVEVALVTGLPGNAIFDAEAACGFGYVIDPDVNGNRRTGNGPRNWSDCPD